MRTQPYRYRAPAKLMLAGEYSVLGPSGLSLSIAVADHGVEAIAQPANAWQLAREELALTWEPGQSVPFEFSFAHSAWQLASQEKATTDPCLKICTTNYGEAIGPSGKPGLGSSASAVVAVAAATLGASVSDEPQWKARVLDIAQRAHCHSQGKRGSGYDVATATLGGWVVWRKGAGGDYAGKGLAWPQALHCLAGYCGKSADTRHYLNGFGDWLHSGAAHVDRELEQLSAPVEALLQALVAEDFPGVNRAVHRAHRSLLDWDQRFRMNIITAPIAEMISIADSLGVAAKVSGAGGGDSLIALSDDPDQLTNLANRWKDAGFWPYRVHVDPHGLRRVD